MRRLLLSAVLLVALAWPAAADSCRITLNFAFAAPVPNRVAAVLIRWNTGSIDFKNVLWRTVPVSTSRRYFLWRNPNNTWGQNRPDVVLRNHFDISGTAPIDVSQVHVDTDHKCDALRRVNFSYTFFTAIPYGNNQIQFGEDITYRSWHPSSSGWSDATTVTLSVRPD